MAAIYEINHDSFGNGSIYNLKKGAVLRMPPRYMIDEISGDPARLKSILRKATGTPLGV